MPPAGIAKADNRGFGDGRGLGPPGLLGDGGTGSGLPGLLGDGGTGSGLPELLRDGGTESGLPGLLGRGGTRVPGRWSDGRAVMAAAGGSEGWGGRGTRRSGRILAGRGRIRPRRASAA